MKAIPYILLLPLALIVLLTQCEKDPAPVNIPDDAFLNALIEVGVDAKGDGKISPVETEVITYLDVSSNSISDMTGIEAFINLDTLNCRGNQLTSLDVSNNTGLTELVCDWNQLTSLDVSNNTGLHALWCERNQLTSLDVSNNTALKTLFCRNNQLTSLDVSNNTALIYLVCNNNQLTSLDVSNNTALIDLRCGGNQLTTLDVSNNTALTILHCSNNQLTSLDVSNNMQLRNLLFGEMPSLIKVCVWILPFPPDELTIDKEGSDNVYFTTDCSK